MADEPTWRTWARCSDSGSAGYFYPPGHLERRPEKHEREESARRLCEQCSVRAQCLDYAIAIREPHGIWGGLNELERRRMVRRASPEERSA